jgi:hypothetical protein
VEKEGLSRLGDERVCGFRPGSWIRWVSAGWEMCGCSELSLIGERLGQGKLGGVQM